jgi:hypothetical protein
LLAVRALEFTQEPDYDALLRIFIGLQEKLGQDPTVIFLDWNFLKKV